MFDILVRHLAFFLEWVKTEKMQRILHQMSMSGTTLWNWGEMRLERDMPRSYALSLPVP